MAWSDRAELEIRLQEPRASTLHRRFPAALSLRILSGEWPGGNHDSATVTWTGPGALHVSLSAWTGVTLPRPPLAGLVLTVTQAPPEADAARGHRR